MATEKAKAIQAAQEAERREAQFAALLAAVKELAEKVDTLIKQAKSKP